jgi:hypothetical protein
VGTLVSMPAATAGQQIPVVSPQSDTVAELLFVCDVK